MKTNHYHSTNFIYLALSFITLFSLLLGGCSTPEPTTTPESVAAEEAESPTEPPPPTATQIPPSPTPIPPTTAPTEIPPTPTQLPPMELHASAFEAEGELPLKYAIPPFEATLQSGHMFKCAGNPADKENLSPSLAWNYVPTEAKSLVLIMVDDMHYAYPDVAAEGTFFPHWIVYNISPSITELSEGLTAELTLPDGTLQGLNSYPEPYNQGYGGPCPGVGEQHLYIFTLYALDTVLDLEPGARLETVMTTLNEHILSQVELPVYYTGK